ncbi:MAG: YlmC/YmxH family sporulation protein [Thermovenabulum sp.]|uniref:YlmC/YmxH family sporulation protein n=1 Tax=Thermovenabulum sp. TaxID=3100335 RepID=UPI003C7CEC22
MLKATDLRQKEVINVCDGKKMGFIVDIDIDTDVGKIKSLILPAISKGFNIFLRSDDIEIPWEKVKKIGQDVILVEYQETLKKGY